MKPKTLQLISTGIPELCVIRGQCVVTGKEYKSGPVDRQTFLNWVASGQNPKDLPYPEATVRFAVTGISPKGWRIINTES